MRFRLIPVLLLDGERLVKTVMFRDPAYIGDPINAVRLFNEKEVDELCLLDISATRNSMAPNYSLLEEIVSEAFMPVAYGGGIRTLVDIDRLFRIGIEKVVLNSIVYEEPSLICEGAAKYGEQSIVLSIDVKKNLIGQYTLRSHGGMKKQGGEMLESLDALVERGAGELMMTFIDNDGMRNGMNVDAIKQIVNNLDIPVVACGGVGTLEHLRATVYETGVSAIGVGSFCVQYGKHRAVLITYPSRTDLDALENCAPQ